MVRTLRKKGQVLPTTNGIYCWETYFLTKKGFYFYVWSYLFFAKTFFHFFLRVLGSPNPGQSFGRGLSGPQATEVSRDPRGSWAATNLTVHSSNSFLGPSFWHPALGSYSWIASFDVFRFFRVFKPRGRYVDFGRLLADPIMEDTVVKQLFFFFPTLRTFFLA